MSVKIKKYIGGLGLSLLLGGIALSIMSPIGGKKAWGQATSVAPAPETTTTNNPLSNDDLSAISKAEAYLNQIQTTKAHFVQTSSKGGQASGTAYLKRPGKMRLAYDPPSPLLIIANGQFLIVIDKTVDNPSYIPLDQTPAGILVRSHVSLNAGDLKVTHVDYQSDEVFISVIEAKNPGLGSLTLIFSKDNYELKAWRITDAANVTVTVALDKIENNIPLSNNLFSFKDPNFSKPNF